MKIGIFFPFLAAQLLYSVPAAYTDVELASAEDLKAMKTSIFANEDEIATSVGFFSHERNPYPNHVRGYNVDIDYDMNCYVIFQDEQKSSYTMMNSVENPDPTNPFGSFFSHQGPCGVCSSLQDLSVYLEKRDLKTPVRKCAMMLRSDAKRKCIKNLGFTERCTWIWFWNSMYTRKGCLNVCLRYFTTPNNQDSGKYNPCKPIEGQLPNREEDDDDELEEEVEGENEISASTVPTLLTQRDRKKTLFGRMMTNRATASLAGVTDIKRKAPTLRKKKKKPKGCRTSINGGPACVPMQYENGPHRLNPCLQCDECKAGPMFKKVAGRVRRNSGIRSAIDRPGVPVLDHHYFTNHLVKDEL